MSQNKASGWAHWLSVPLMFAASVAAACIITATTIGPNLEGFGHVLMPLVCAIPLSMGLFGFQVFRNKRKDIRGAIPALMVYPVLFGLLFGFTMIFQRNPRNIFRVFVADPIPGGVTDIQAKDVSVGFDQDVILSFQASQEVIDMIIAERQLELSENRTNGKGNFPNDYFPEYVWGTNWLYYYRSGKPGSWIMMWVDPQQSIVILRFVG